MSEKQITALTQASKKKKQEALAKTQEAINNLLEKKQKITIRSVAREAGVSVSYIYKYPELSYRIQTLREQQKYSLVKSDRSLDSRDNHLKVLEQEKAELIKEIEQLKANITNPRAGANDLNTLQAENIRLQAENQQLKRELNYTKQNLQAAREFILSQGYNTKDESNIKTREKVIQHVVKDKTNTTHVLPKKCKNKNRLIT